MSAPAAPLPPDPADPGVSGPAAGRAGPKPPAVFLAYLFARPRANWAQVEAIRAEHEQWPPPLGMAGGSRSARRAPGGLVRPAGALTLLENACQRGRDGVPCVYWRAGTPGIRCSRCGMVTPVESRRVGPRLVACDCGLPAICVHPTGRPR